MILCVLPNEAGVVGKAALGAGRRAKFLSTLIQHAELFAEAEAEREARAAAGNERGDAGVGSFSIRL